MAEPLEVPCFISADHHAEHFTLWLQQELGLTAEDLQRRGKPILYRPDRLFKLEAENIQDWKHYTRYQPGLAPTTEFLSSIDYNPLPTGCVQIPFSIPFGIHRLKDDPNGLLRSGPLLRNKYVSTRTNVKTKIAKAVRGLDRNDRLTHVKHCPHLLTALQAYADPQSEGVIPRTARMRDYYNSVYGVDYDGQTMRGMTTLGGPDDYSLLKTLEYPSAIQQYQAICGLASWYLLQRHRAPAIVESEEAVSDEVRARVLEPLQLMLQTRYTSRATPETLLMTMDVGGTERLRKWSKNIMFPRFARLSRNMVAEPMPDTDTKNKAGFGDAAVINQRGTQATLNIEFKAFWGLTYRDDIYENLPNLVKLRPTGPVEMDWTAKKCPANDLLKQIWGEMLYGNTKWGFTTNGSKVIPYVKTRNNELTIGDAMDITDVQLLPTLAGLAFASIDGHKRNRGLREYLCEGSVLVGTR